MQNVMVDLETLGTAADAVILSIGAVQFDTDGSPLGERFYTEVDIDDQLALGRTVTGKTISWWVQQSRQAQGVFKEVHKKTLHQALCSFAVFFDHPNYCVWGNGAEFDNAILIHAYAQAGDIQQPWSHRNNRCYRTLKNLSNRPRRDDSMPNVPHNALDDAIAQALHCQEMLYEGDEIDNAEAIAGFLISEV